MHTHPQDPGLGIWETSGYPLLAKALPGDLHPRVTGAAGSTLPKPGQAPGMQQTHSVPGSHLHHCHNLKGKTFPGVIPQMPKCRTPKELDCRNGHRMEVPQLLLGTSSSHVFLRGTWAQQEFTFPSLPWSRGPFQFDLLLHLSKD